MTTQIGHRQLHIESRESWAREARSLREAGLSLRQIADRLGVSPDTVQRWTSVEVPEDLLQWAHATGRTLRLLEPDEEDPVPGTPFFILQAQGLRLIRDEPDRSWSLPAATRRRI